MVDSTFAFTSYARLFASALLHSLVLWKRWLSCQGNDFSLIPFGVVLGGEPQIEAKNSIFEIFVSALHMKSVSMPLSLPLGLQLDVLAFTMGKISNAKSLTMSYMCPPNYQNIEFNVLN